MNQKPQSIIDGLSSLKPNEVFVSGISVAELEYGVAKSAKRALSAQRLSEFLLPMQILGFDTECTKSYGEIRSSLEKKRGIDWVA